MAYWFRKPNGHVFVLYRKDGRSVPLPRAKVKHLDSAEDHSIDAFTNQVALNYEGKERKITPENLVGSDTELGQYLAAYLDYLKTRGKSVFTIQHHKSVLERHILPFFLEGDTPLRDPAQWPGKSIKFLQHLTNKGVKGHTIQLCNTTLRGFYKYLVEEGRIQTGVDIKLRSPVMEAQATPLSRIIEPEEILSFARTCTDSALKLTALLGYFASLRPQETFALRPCDLIAGTKAEFLECSKTMKDKHLYGKLVVNIHRQKQKNGKFATPKAYSKGHVAIFNEEAAKMIVETVKGISNPKESLFRFLPDWHGKEWSKKGIKGISCKDLRRASLYFLAHRTDMNDLISLMKHARHKNPDTTMLYLRRPEENIGEWGGLDLDA